MESGVQGDRTSLTDPLARDSVDVEGTCEDAFARGDNLVIMAVCIHRDAIGIATYVSEVAEISIFDSMQAESMEDELLPVFLALSLHSPGVLLVGENTGVELRTKLAKAAGPACELVLVKPWWYRIPNAEKNIEELWISGMSQDLGTIDRKHYILSLLPVAASDEVVGALGALLSCIYAQKLLGTVEVLSGETLHMLQSLSQFNLKEHLQVDLPTLSALQILSSEAHPSNFVNSSKEGLSLYTLLDHCCTSQGKRLLKNWLLNPITNIREIEQRQGEVSYFLSLPSELLNTMQDHLCVMKTMSSTLRQVMCHQGCGRTSKGHLIMLHRYLVSGVELTQTCAQVLQWQGPSCAEASSVEGLVTLNRQAMVQMILALAKTLDIRNEDPVLEDEFFVAKGVSGTLDEYKEIFAQLPGILNKILQEELRRIPTALVRKHQKTEWSVLHLPQFGFVMQMKSLLSPDLKEVFGDFAFVSDFRKEFFLYKSKSTARLDETFGNLHMKIQDLETAILSQFTFEILQDKLWQELVERTAKLDVLLSLASVAKAHGLQRPRMVNDNVLLIKNGRHILNERTVNGSFIPNDSTFLEDSDRIHVITGPNFSGKTVYAKQVALIVYMAHVGSFVPADEALIGICDKIMTRMDSIDASSSGQSSFMMDLTQVLNSVRNATSRSIILLDEFGRGTDSSDGFGLFFSILSAFAQRPYPPRIIACTHFSCTTFLQHAPKSSHLSFKKMECFIERKTAKTPEAGAELHVERSDSKVIYLYRLVEGISDNSLGIFCARLAGLADSIWQRSFEILTLRSNCGGRLEDLKGVADGTQDKIHHKLSRFLNLDLSPSADFQSVRTFLQPPIS
ncbi:DNA mismatch repair protein MSH5 [Chloropicon primus]|uniref:DNA mismatch repair protein MSH5 n=2 Tax=Chloropicon primus TaxID=1764295 RepID=A0A5B8MPE7_9CHLO|nr:DNA mismatch repair protein MSH5 [Chloropicon primus]UPR01144.1 DNA mismatch repair protein MSH5 [Chloropicon primus]|eukprot:QDZ21924.1 DNA mismatch repair protein MSH5 [Chloropicon primus]